MILSTFDFIWRMDGIFNMFQWKVNELIWLRGDLTVITARNCVCEGVDPVFRSNSSTGWWIYETRNSNRFTTCHKNQDDFEWNLLPFDVLKHLLCQKSRQTISRQADFAIANVWFLGSGSNRGPTWTETSLTLLTYLIGPYQRSSFEPWPPAMGFYNQPNSPPTTSSRAIGSSRDQP